MPSLSLLNFQLDWANALERINDKIDMYTARRIKFIKPNLSYITNENRIMVVKNDI